MKKLLLIVFMAASLPMCLNVHADEIEISLTAEKVIINVGSEKPARTPLARPTLTLDGYTLYIGGAQRDYTLQLVDEDGDVVYEAFLPAGTTSFLLPTCYAGAYRLNLLWSDWCFWGYVEL